MLHIYQAIHAALSRWPEVADLAFQTESPDSFRESLMQLLDVDEVQANAVSDMQVRRAGRLERAAVARRLAELRAEVAPLDSDQPS
jgi:DNA gyrase/topoisomerase IV subunit A